VIPVETTPGSGGGGMKENGWGSIFMYDVFDIF
jgi:hypothetical protein